MHPLILAGAAIIAVVCLVILFFKAVIPAWQRAQQLIRQYNKPGEVPPKPKRSAWLKGRRLCKFFLRWQVGKVKIVELNLVIRQLTELTTSGNTPPVFHFGFLAITYSR